MLAKCAVSCGSCMPRRRLRTARHRCASCSRHRSCRRALREPPPQPPLPPPQPPQPRSLVLMSTTLPFAPAAPSLASETGPTDAALLCWATVRMCVCACMLCVSYVCMCRVCVCLVFVRVSCVYVSCVSCVSCVLCVSCVSCCVLRVGRPYRLMVRYDCRSSPYRYRLQRGTNTYPGEGSHKHNASNATPNRLQIQLQTDAKQAFMGAS